MSSCRGGGNDNGDAGEAGVRFGVVHGDRFGMHVVHGDWIGDGKGINCGVEIGVSGSGGNSVYSKQGLWV